MVRLVLDAGAFDYLGSTKGRDMRGLLLRASQRKHEVCCAAVTLAEVCRGTARTREVESALSRKYGGQRIRVVPTDERLAKLVGAMLHTTGNDSSKIADAHVVAVCAAADSAMVLTVDADDITTLATAIPGTRVLTRHPERLATHLP